MSVDQAVNLASALLKGGGIEEARFEARILLGHVLGATREELLLGYAKGLSKNKFDELMSLAARRAAREPIAYLTGEREFWGLSFEVTRDTLIPRPDSETLIEAVLAFTRVQGYGRYRILDIGTGSGCLLISLLKEMPEAEGVATDSSLAALEVARRNAARHGVLARAHFAAVSWGNALKPPFDLIVANPPYVAESARTSLMPDVAEYEPTEALFAGDVGEDAYVALAPDLARLIAPEGRIFVELGQGCGGRVSGLFKVSGLRECARWRDLAGVERCAVFVSAESAGAGIWE